MIICINNSDAFENFNTVRRTPLRGLPAPPPGGIPFLIQRMKIRGRLEKGFENEFGLNKGGHTWKHGRALRGLTFYLGPDRPPPFGNLPPSYDDVDVQSLVIMCRDRAGLIFLFRLGTHLFGRGYGHVEVFPAAFKESLKPYELLQCRDKLDLTIQSQYIILLPGESTVC